VRPNPSLKRSANGRPPGPAAFVLADHWDSDPCAVGVASPRDGGVLVYITCHGERPDRFPTRLANYTITVFAPAALAKSSSVTSR